MSRRTAYESLLLATTERYTLAAGGKPITLRSLAHVLVQGAGLDHAAVPRPVERAVADDDVTHVAIRYPGALRAKRLAGERRVYFAPELGELPEQSLEQRGFAISHGSQQQRECVARDAPLGYVEGVFRSIWPTEYSSEVRDVVVFGIAMLARIRLCDPQVLPFRGIELDLHAVA